MTIEPNRRLPGRIFALMWGESLRYEAIDGSGDEVVHGKKLWIKFGEKPRCLPGRKMIFVLTHLQRRCHFGVFFSPWPFQLHFWFHWHLQETKVNEHGVTLRVPNSERGVYVRFPGYRWDLERGMIFTGGRAPGAHWD